MEEMRYLAGEELPPPPEIFESTLSLKKKADSETLKDIQHLKQFRARRSDDCLNLPDNFEVGQAIGGGDCFFDSIVQGLKQIKPEMNFTVKELRKICKRLVIDNKQLRDKVIRDAKNNHDSTVVLPDATISDDELWNAYLASIEYTKRDIEGIYSDNPSLYELLTSSKYGSTLQAPIWGRPDIEGQLICIEYNIKLHIAEKFPNVGYLNQVLNGSVSRSVTSVNYNEENTIHLINMGNAHFEPILGTRETQSNRQQSSNHDTPKEKLNISVEEQPIKQERPSEESLKSEVSEKKSRESEQQSPSSSAGRIKKVANDPNQEGSSQQYSNNRQSIQGNQPIDSAQHQQINPNSSDFIDSDDEREKNAGLFSAIKNGDLQRVQELLKAGVKVYIIDKNNKDNTPLHYAIERDKKEISEKLLQVWKADINAKNNKGNTPLHIATSKSNKELVQLLVSKGANTDIKNNEDITPLDIAKYLDKQDILQMLKSPIQPNLLAFVEEQPANRQQFQGNIRSGSNNGQGYNTQSPSQATQLISKQKSGKYKIQRRQGTTGSLDGHFYEIDLLILVKLRGDRGMNKFYLATNLNGLGAFDDLVIRYWKNNGEEGKSTTILLQAKHVDDPKKGKVTIAKFKNPKNEKFYLGKYFLDYLNSREKFKDTSEDPVFQGIFQKLDLQYIIYTNAILDEQFDENRKTAGTDNNSIFSTKSKENKDKAFKLSLNDKNRDVIETLERVSCQERIKLLAKALVSCFSGKLNYNNMMVNEFFSTYHVFLAQNVIDVGEEIKEDKNKIKYQEGKIGHNFLNRPTDKKDPLKKVLKEEVLYEYAKNVIFKEKSGLVLELDDKSELNDLVNKVAKSLKSSKKVNEDVIEKLGGKVIILDTKNKQLKFADQNEIKNERAKKFIIDLKSKVGNLADYEFDIPYKFVEKTLTEHIEEKPLKLHVDFGNINPSFKKSEHLKTKLIELFVNYKSQKIIKIDDSVFGHGKMLTEGDVKNIGKLVGNLLVFDEEKKMLRLASEESLNGDALDLIKELKITARQNELEVNDYRFDIKVKNFPREILVTDAEDRNNVIEFLNKLEVLTGQASDAELKEIIKNEIRDLYKLTEEEVEDNFLKIRDKAEEYWRKGDYYLERNDNIFTNIIKFNIEFDLKEPVDFFSGREKELSDLHNKMQRSSEKVTVISGLGGIGKTELARKYAYGHGNYYDGNVIWINAESYETLVESFLRLAQDKLEINVKITEGNQTGIKSVVDDVYRFFSKRKSLFIFDNSGKRRTQDDGDEGIDTFLPSLPFYANKPYILITSRNQKWENIEVVPLGTFTEKEATDFIRTSLNIKDDSQNNEIQKLVELLEQFPLALTQSVAYMKQADEEVKNVDPEREFKIDDYLKEYKMKTKELLNFPFPDDSNDKYSRTTYTTFQVTIDKIKKKENGKKALEILDIIAYFAGDNIPAKIFLEQGENDERKLGATVQLLKQYSMVNLERGVLSVHRLVQEVSRINLVDQKREEETLRKALELIKSDNSEKKTKSLPQCIFYPCKRDGKLSASEIYVTYIWSYASKYGQLIKDFYSTYGEKANTPINLFATAGKIEAIEYILKNIEKDKLIDKVNEYNAMGYAPIHSAAFNGHKEIVQYLIEKHEVDINCITRGTKNTPTFVAVLGGHLDIVQYLVSERRADPNKGLHFPILYAALYARKDLIECLINNNANPLSKDNAGNVLHYALLHLTNCSGMHISLIEEIVKYCLGKNIVLVKDANLNGLTPLHLAVEHNSASIVKMLLDHGADVDAKYHFAKPHENENGLTHERYDYYFKGYTSLKYAILNGMTPLHLAVVYDYASIVKMLLDHGADVNAKYNLAKPHENENGLTPERYDYDEGYTSLKYANLNGMTPLHLAVVYGYASIVKMLLDHGADANARYHLAKPHENENGLTPERYDYDEGYTSLHIAAKENHLESAKLLLQKGAIYRANYDKGSTPLDIAELGSDVEDLLRSIDRSFKAILNGKKDELDNLLKGKGTDVLKSILNARDRNKKTLLLVAHKQKDIQMLLIEKLKLIL